MGLGVYVWSPDYPRPHPVRVCQYAIAIFGHAYVKGYRVVSAGPRPRDSDRRRLENAVGFLLHTHGRIPVGLRGRRLPQIRARLRSVSCEGRQYGPFRSGGWGRLGPRRTRGERGSRVGPLPVQDLHHGAVAAAPHHVAGQSGRFEGAKPVACLVPRKAEAAPHG